MSLTAAQSALLHTAVLAEPTLVGKVGVDDGAVMTWLNALTTFVVWRGLTPVSDIQNAITWANFTPPNPLAGAGQDAANWCLACQGKQFNLQNILAGANGFNGVSTGKANIRAGLQDALTAIPAGNAAGVMNGSLVGAGWLNVQTAIQRFATNAEKVLATGTGTTASPGDLGYDGNIAYSDINPIVGRV